MVDFRKRLRDKAPKKPVDPIEIYAGLDRASDKGPLRPQQDAILQEWQAHRRNERDVILKMHTGQGKTLVGLVILQSKLNEDGRPAVYLCPSRYLAAQTRQQAKQFGIATCSTDSELPAAFLDGKSILVATTQKLFNGRTKFGLRGGALQVGSMVLDDAHASVDSIRSAFRIGIPAGHGAYNKLKSLFSEQLRAQGAGTFADIEAGRFGAMLAVPYWSWADRQEEVVDILAGASGRNEPVFFQWPLMRDSLLHCQCFISGQAIEIEPYLPDLNSFGSFVGAGHRVFMSATTADDSFLIKGLRVEAGALANPLLDPDEKWSGEKMVLMPSLIDEDLTRTEIINAFGGARAKRRYGLVGLVPSGRTSEIWADCGAFVADKSSIEAQLNRLRRKEFSKALVLVNRYDGVDLPDAMCRILIFDSRPYAEQLADRYADACRPQSEVTALRAAKRIEQGMGRCVRGEKDYAAILMIGDDLIRSLRSKASRQHLSSQAQAQIEIGLQIAEFAKEEVEEGDEAMSTLVGLIKKCLQRDEGWKQFYVAQMDAADVEEAENPVFQVLETELRAEQLFQSGDAKGAHDAIQDLINTLGLVGEEKGWYLQEMARYLRATRRLESEKLQATAQRLNSGLLKPPAGVVTEQLTPIGQKRAVAISEWMKGFDSQEEVRVYVADLLADLSLGVVANKFEDALDRLGGILGFSTQRPDKQYNAGPDNLWALGDSLYLLVECKNQVDAQRAEIYKDEAKQINTSLAWFAEQYPDATARPLLIHPAGKCAHGAALSEGVRVMRADHLRTLKTSVRDFFAEFREVDPRTLDDRRVQQALDRYSLNVSDLPAKFSKAPYRPRTR